MTFLSIFDIKTSTDASNTSCITMASPAPHPLSSRQLSSLRAIVNALLPPLEVDNDESNDEIQAYWSFDLSRDSDFVDALTLAIQTKLNSLERLQLLLLLSTLSTTVGTMAVFRLFTTTPFCEWTCVEDQTLALQKLQHAPLVLKRQAFSSLKRLICGLAYSYIQASTETNPFWKAIQYPGPPLNEKQEKQDFDTTKAFVNVTQDNTILDYDVVIVGSGAGGGVAAAILSEAGYSVCILEKGEYVPPSDVSNLEVEALDCMYEKHSLLTTNDGNVMILAGSTLGGGTTVNWACCLPLPENVRQEWISEHGLRQFGSTDYEESLKAVQERIGCLDTDEHHNVANTIFMQGCKVMGYNCQATGQNLKDAAAESAGYTCFGDAQRNKQGGIVTYLADAVANGARIMEHAAVQRVLYETTNGRKRATGVVAFVGDEKYKKTQVNARKCVIVAAGSLHSPCTLQRSNFRNPHIGKHLHLHPVTAVSGFYSEEDVHAYLGAPMTTVCSDFPQTKLECPSAHTGLLAAGLPFLDPWDFKEKMLRLRHAVPVIVLTRDVSSEGRVRVSMDGFNPSIEYTLRKNDKQNIMQAMKGAVQILVASGASQVGTGHDKDPGLYLEEDETHETAEEIQNSAKIQDYLASIQDRGIQKHSMGIFSAHQMSTCRMSISSDAGVVDENGESWECDDLFVMDTSVFPTASGANPMLTTLTISHMLSSRLAERLQYEDLALKHKQGSAGESVEMPEWMQERKKRRARQPRYGYDRSLMVTVTTVVVAVASAGLANKYWK